MGIERITWPSWPQYDAEDARGVLRVIQSNQIFAGPEVKKFESAFADYIGVGFSIGVGNATQGLHLALAALDIGDGHEVIVTPYSWISSASCVLMQNAVPIFADIERRTFGLDVNDIKRKITQRTRAVIAVHMFGYPCDIGAISDLCRQHGLALIEDASHAHGAKVGNQKIGSIGDIAVFSLHQRKSLSVGDGGIICTNNESIAQRLRRLRSFGDVELSYNYRMTEFAAALGQSGLKKLDRQNHIRADNVRRLKERLTGSNLSLRVVDPSSDDQAVYFAVLLEVDENEPDVAGKVARLADKGIAIRNTWAPLHLHPHFNPYGKAPARGLPWCVQSYDGQMKGKRYCDLMLPVVSELCPNRILELYVHPPTNSLHIDFAANCIAEEFRR